MRSVLPAAKSTSRAVAGSAPADGDGTGGGGSSSVLDYSPTSSSGFLKFSRSISTNDSRLSSIRQTRSESDPALDDLWPLISTSLGYVFQGEGFKKTSVEDLNSYVDSHIRQCTQENCPELIAVDFVSLLDHNMRVFDISQITLEDLRLVDHLGEVWSFYFKSVLPYIEAIFLPFQSHPELQIETRKLALVSFRDTVVVPLDRQLQYIFANLHQLDLSEKMKSETIPQLLHCLASLASCQTSCEFQASVSSILSTLNQNWFKRKTPGNYDRRHSSLSPPQAGPSKHGMF